MLSMNISLTESCLRVLSVIDVMVTVFFFFCFFKCLNATILLTCTLANEYTSSNGISKKNSTEGIVSLAGRSGGAMVLGKLPVPGRPTIWRGWCDGAG